MFWAMAAVCGVAKWRLWPLLAVHIPFILLGMLSACAWQLEATGRACAAADYAQPLGLSLALDVIIYWLARGVRAIWDRIRTGAGAEDTSRRP